MSEQEDTRYRIYRNSTDYISDYVNHPKHYTHGAIECIDAIEAALGQEGFIAYLRGQVIKYQWRMGHKNNAIEDNQKAIWYANKLNEKLEEQVKVEAFDELQKHVSRPNLDELSYCFVASYKRVGNNSFDLDFACGYGIINNFETIEKLDNCPGCLKKWDYRSRLATLAGVQQDLNNSKNNDTNKQ